jgi:hypothetical protein
VFALLFLIFAVATVSPAAGTPEAAPTPQVADVSVFLLGVRDFDQRRGSYVMDGYLDFNCPQGCTPEKFELSNGTILTKEDATAESGRFTYRVTALLYGAMDMRKYPFDRQDLRLVVEDKVLNNQALRYRADPKHTSRDPEMQVPGWNIVSVSSGVDDHYYVTWDESYSRFTYHLLLARPVISSVVKVILPPILVVMCSFFALLLPLDRINRLAVLTSTFITAVLLQLNSSANLPPVSYLTYMDVFMLLNYTVIVASIGLTVLIGRRHDAGEQDAARTMNRRVQRIVPVLWLLAQLLFAVVFLY